MPRDYVTGETVDSALSLMESSAFAADLDGSTWERAVASAERLRLNPVPGDTRGIGGNAARCALEIAWLDA